MTPNADPFLLFRWPLSGRTTAVLTIAGPLEPDDLETLLGNLEAAKRALTKAAGHPSRPAVPMSLRELRRQRADMTAEIEKIFDNRRAGLEEEGQARPGMLYGTSAENEAYARELFNTDKKAYRKWLERERAMLAEARRETESALEEALQDAAEEGGRLPFTLVEGGGQ